MKWLFSRRKNRESIKPEEPPNAAPKAAPKAQHFYTKDEIMNLQDDKKLLEIAKDQSELRDKRELAISRMKDQTPIFEMYRNHPGIVQLNEKSIWLCGLTDQRLIREIAVTEKRDQTLQKVAANKLKDPEMIKDCLLHCSFDIPARQALLKKLSPQALREVAEQSEISQNSEDALRMINDPKLLADYLIHRPKAPAWLLRQITDKALLKQISEESVNSNVRTEALKMLGGYVCTACGKLNLGEDVTCLCKYCRAENHDYVLIDNVVAHRDYESGERHRECTRCGKIIDMQTVYTM